MTDPSAEVASVLRDAAFSEIERVANLTASFARSAAEAAFRGDQTTLGAHVRQARLCVISMIQTYKDYIDGQSLAEAGRPPDAHRDDQRTGDVVA